MSDKPRALRLADRLDWWGNKDVREAAAELRRLHGEVESLQRAYNVVTELREVTEAMDDPAINNVITLADAVRALKAERNGAVALLREVGEKFIYKGRGATHWEGCEESHPDCAMGRRIEAIIDAARDKP